MLKTVQAPGPISPSEEERPIGELVHELIEDGKAYARAELDLGKAIATQKANAVKLPAILFFGAMLILQSAVTVLGFAFFVAMLQALGPIASGVIVALVMAGIAGALAWYGVSKLREDL